jgi:hypothetical protein
VIAFFTARANVRRDIEKMQAQLDAQQTATEQERIVDLRPRYVTPLRYHAATLSFRLLELEAKLGPPTRAESGGGSRR